MSDLDERTQPATPRRIEDARARGQAARSADLTGGAALLAGALALELFGGALFGALAGQMRDGLSTVHAATAEDGGSRLFAVAGRVAAPMAPIAAIVLAAAVAVGLAQVGFLFTLAPLAPRAERVAFSAERLWSFGRAAAVALKLAVVLAVLALTVWTERAVLSEVEQPVVAAGKLAFTIAVRASIALLALGLVDYAWRRYRHEQSLRMTPQEAREEMRRHEGDPQVRERRRAVQRRRVHRVEGATVVLSGDGHAVALEYADGMAAPRVAAKGAGDVARDILDRARAAGVRVVERDDVAELYRRADVGEFVPAGQVRAAADAIAVARRA